MVFVLLNNIINAIFPPKCIFCEAILDLKADINICCICYKKIPFINSYNFNNITKRTPNSNYFDDIICLCEYSGIIKSALKKYKFNDKSAYHRTLAKMLSDKIKEMTNCINFDIIISVPLHKKKEMIRGYNQSLLISKAISNELGIKEKSRLISRIKNTRNQSMLDKNERSLNIAGAFKINIPDKVCGKMILIVDDIMTTGNTLNECCRVLKEAGANKVVAAVIASGRKF
jgi:competence protein ComFC